MLKSAIRRKIEKHLKLLKLITSELNNIKNEAENKRELSSVYDSVNKAGRAIELVEYELGCSLKKLPSAKIEISIEFIK